LALVLVAAVFLAALLLPERESYRFLSGAVRLETMQFQLTIVSHGAVSTVPAAGTPRVSTHYRTRQSFEEVQRAAAAELIPKGWVQISPAPGEPLTVFTSSSGETIQVSEGGEITNVFIVRDQTLADRLKAWFDNLVD
jgi:hypothetical protein